jgi:hypothetical protein
MNNYIKYFLNYFRKNKTISWKNIEYFDPNWKKRIKDMSEFIDSGSTIIDLGCGEMWLKEFITGNEVYIPVDYKSRGDGTVVCDFNKYEYPRIDADVAFVSGCLEYIKDYEWFIENICINQKKCILSYCTIEDFPQIPQRTEFTWVNHLSEFQIIKLFEKYSFKLVDKRYGYSTFYIMEKQFELR